MIGGTDARLKFLLIFARLVQFTRNSEQGRLLTLFMNFAKKELFRKVLIEALGSHPGGDGLSLQQAALSFPAQRTPFFNWVTDDRYGTT